MKSLKSVLVLLSFPLSQSYHFNNVNGVNKPCGRYRRLSVKVNANINDDINDDINDGKSDSSGLPQSHLTLLSESYSTLTSTPFPLSGLSPSSIHSSPTHILLSHDTSPSPLFTYANLLAQSTFKSSLIGIESKYSASTSIQPSREDLLNRVTAHGYVDDYEGVRVDSEGNEFMIKNATVWNLVDYEGVKIGQAAMFLYDDLEFL
mmetsp:Transcript_27119/g.51378  ORF Transcript_27119/g.51378 Transcript_27119/m.51378 type:complete len:205 (+) Transcript_27119:113-727(+)